VANGSIETGEHTPFQLDERVTERSLAFVHWGSVTYLPLVRLSHRGGSDHIVIRLRADALLAAYEANSECSDED